MSNGISVKIEGFKELETLMKTLPDKVKKNEVNKVLNQIVNPLYQMMKQLTPVSSGVIKTKSGTYRIKRRRIGKTVIADTYRPGYGKTTIAKKKMTRAKNPLISVGPHTRKGKDGFYLRQWVIPGTTNFKGNDFVATAEKVTAGIVSSGAEKKIARYIQKQINRLSTI